MTRYIDTKETATMMRQALKAAFPGTKFSVRKGTGTASAWIDVSWIDGPTDQAVTKLVDRYEGSTFNSMTDSYDINPNVLLATADNELPEEVHFVVHGVNTHRAMSEDAKQSIIDRISDALDGADFTAENMEWLHVGNIRIRTAYDIHNAIWQVFSATDYSAKASTA